MNIVKELRKKKGVQQKELAIAIGVAQPTVSEWEANKKDPSGDRLRNLANYFGVDELVILGYRSAVPSVQNDEDVMAIREQLRRDPNTRALFDAARKASPEHIRAAAAMLKALEPEDLE